MNIFQESNHWHVKKAKKSCKLHQISTEKIPGTQKETVVLNLTSNILDIMYIMM